MGRVDQARGNWTAGWVAALGIALLANGCGGGAAPAREPAAPAAAAKPVFGTFGIDLSTRKAAVKPGDDFFAYTNGTWLDTFPIPPDKASYGVAEKLDDEARANVRKIIEDAAGAHAAAGSIEQKIGDYYASFMDTAKIEASGVNALKPDLDHIAAAKTPADLSRLFGEPGFMSPIGVYVGPDDKNPDAYFVNLIQSGLGLPDRDYYLKDDPKLKEIRAAYVAHIGRMLTLAGVADGPAKATKIMALETRIARAHWPAEKTRDAIANYNPKARAAVVAFAPGLDWQTMFDALEVGKWDLFNVNTPSAVKDIAALVTSQPLDDWKAYLTYHQVHNNAPYLPKAIDEENFAFFGKTLAGRQTQRERWQRGTDLVNNALGEAIGQVYVKRHFPPAAKAKIDALVENMRAAYKANIETLTWMGPETRAKALEKLASLRPKIGYPAKWKDYSSMTIVPGNLLANVHAAEVWSWRFNVNKLGKPVDKDEWLITPQTVNAYYYPPTNEITFPAAILRWPFYDMTADDAVNYGGIGSVIGHEMSHHFDDQGSKYDAHGKLTDWWTAASAKLYTGRASDLVKQYDAYEPLPGVHVQGKLTMGENVADLAGLTVAHDAYVASLNGAPPPVIDGMTGDQRFYLGWAQVWRRNYREPNLRQRILTDPHSPNPYRADIVRNMDPWYEAFKPQSGQKLYLAPADRVRIW